MRYFAALFCLFYSIPGVSGFLNGISYEGRLLQADGTPYEGDVTMSFSILGKGENCVLYKESQLLNLGNTSTPEPYKGVFSTVIGDLKKQTGVPNKRTDEDPENEMWDVFTNSGPYNSSFAVNGCTVAPALGEGRRLRIEVTSGSTTKVLSPDHALSAVPSAFFARRAYESYYATEAGQLATPSDQRIKSEIKPFTEGLDVILSIDPVQFVYNKKDKQRAGQKEIGVIAQQIEGIEKFGSYLVTKKKSHGLKDLRHVKYHSFFPLLINAIREQQEMIDDNKLYCESVGDKNLKLSDRIDTLERENQKLRDHLSRLEERLQKLER